MSSSNQIGITKKSMQALTHLYCLSQFSCYLFMNRRMCFILSCQIFEEMLVFSFSFFNILCRSLGAFIARLYTRFLAIEFYCAYYAISFSLNFLLRMTFNHFTGRDGSFIGWFSRGFRWPTTCLFFYKHGLLAFDGFLCSEGKIAFLEVIFFSLKLWWWDHFLWSDLPLLAFLVLGWLSWKWASSTFVFGGQITFFEVNLFHLWRMCLAPSFRWGSSIHNLLHLLLPNFLVGLKG